MGPITTAIYKAVKPAGVLVNEGFLVKCAGLPDADGNPIRHLIATLDDHLPDTQAHAWGNPEFTDDLWIIEPTQAGIDWSAPKCQICQTEIAS